MHDTQAAKVRRCAILAVEPHEEWNWDPTRLFQSGDGIARRHCWRALAPHLPEPVELEHRHLRLLEAISATRWQHWPAGTDPGLAGELLRIGLVLQEGDQAGPAERDDQLRRMHWHPLAALYHWSSRWQGQDSAQRMRDAGMVTAQDLVQKLGPPPAEATPSPENTSIRLPAAARTALDDLFERRATCRNFDAAAVLDLERFSLLLRRVLGAMGQQDSAGARFLKKNSPSGGGLHSVEPYLLVRNVESVADGVYRYDPVAHCLHPLDRGEVPDGLRLRLLAGQQWFQPAQVLMVMVSRIDRAFWKYRAHAKAYRVVCLDVGHLSQTLYLGATELGLGAFVTAAINEHDIEQVLGLDPMSQVVVALCGFGIRDGHMTTPELDPAGRLWRTDPVTPA